MTLAVCLIILNYNAHMQYMKFNRTVLTFVNTYIIIPVRLVAFIYELFIALLIVLLNLLIYS